MKGKFEKYRAWWSRGALGRWSRAPLDQEVLDRGVRALWRHRVVASLLLVVCVFSAQLTLIKIPQANAAYTISNSARFISGSSAYLSKTFSTPTNAQKFTISTWVKRGKISVDSMIFADDASWDNTGDRGFIGFNSSDQFQIYDVTGGADYGRTYTPVFRDPSAWMHVVVVVDATQAVAEDRQQLYIDGKRIAAVTTNHGDFPQNTNTSFNTAVLHRIGSNWNTGVFSDFYLADYYFVDGQALDATDFGEYDANGYWRPKAYAGTYGTNGFKLDFANGSDLGNDVSGNNNDFTASGLASTDQMIDTPTNGFATGNPLAVGGSPTYTQGNLVSSGAATSTILMSSGKWYWEVKANAGSVVAGVISATGVPSTASVANGTTIGFWFDADAGTLASTTDGTTLNSTISGLTGGRFAYASGASNTFNYGQGGQSGLTYYSSAAGYFKYDPATTLSTNGTSAVTFLTSGTSWSVPSDWNNSNNSIEVIGGGGNGGTGSAGGGGGGGYSKVTNISLTGGASVAYAVGGAAGDTYFCNSTSNCTSISDSAVAVGAKGGTAGGASSAGLGGAAASGVGTVKYSGGNGGSPTNPVVAPGPPQVRSFNAGGGGGAAGLNGAGASGSNGAASGVGSGAGGAGDNGFGGAGGASATAAQSSGSGANGNPGAAGTEYDATHGSGGGGGGAVWVSPGIGGSNTGGAGGAYGAGGGGGAAGGGAGSQGIIVITNTPPGSSTAYSGYKALSTANLPEPDIAVPKNYFDAITYTGTGSTKTVKTSIISFTTTGTTTWQVPTGVTSVDYLVVAGGGGGGGTMGGGGGGGGVKYGTGYTVTPGSVLTVAVGSGGAGASTGDNNGSPGSNSVFDAITAHGGGYGGGNSYAGGSGGSGGGSGETGAGGAGTGGQGNNGGASYDAGGAYGSGGGGGAGAVGANGTASAGGNGGDGVAYSISGSSVYYGGGGGGGSYETNPVGSGGLGGGGNSNQSANGSPGTANTGGGGGGGGHDGANRAGGAGGSGIVIISYTPNASTIGFTPDLVWIKDRTSALMHSIYDSVRSVIPYWSSNSTAAEVGGFGQTLTAFTSNGFTLGTNSLFNTSGNNYVSWMWKESPTNGMDIVTYTGDNTSNRTISHSLGAAPEFVIVKRRDSTGDSWVWHTSLTGAAYFLKLDSSAVQTNTNTPWGTGGWNSSTFMVTNNGTENANANGATYVAYLFKSVDGFSKFGSYTGNASTDGPFIYTGFKPRFLMVKNVTTTATDWIVYDSVREAYNPVYKRLAPNTTAAEVTSDATTAKYDLLSNGFKSRGGDGTFANTNGDTYIYAAFAEQPFQQSAQPYNLTIASSTRFVSGNSAYLSRTFGAGNRQKWTASVWVKRGSLGSTQVLMSDGSTSFTTNLYFDSSDKLNAQIGDGSAASYSIVTNPVFRDPAAWLHIVWMVDTTQSTAANRNILYVNGTQVTSFSSTSYPTQNLNSGMNNSNAGRIGDNSSSTHFYFDGYLADTYFIDGSALAPTCFGEYDANGYWRPKPYSTGSPCAAYGTNGFHLDFANGSALGTDTSGNGNTFTASGLASTDNVKDSPTNSFATLNSLQKRTGNVISSGNLHAETGPNPNDGAVVSNPVTLCGPSSKWYWEQTIVNNNNHGQIAIGVHKASDGSVGQNDSTSVITTKWAGDSASDYPAFGTYAVALDVDAGKVWIRKADGTWDGGGDPAAGTSPTATFAPTLGESYCPLVAVSRTSSQADTAKADYNFGQGGQSGLTYDSASGGYFKYTPPSGFKALSTANLPTPTITQPNNYFNAVIYTGTGATLSVLNSSTSPVTITGFQPDLVWIKDRSAANAHGIFDSVRGLVYPSWASNTSGAESANAGTALTSFLSNGFSLGASTTVNTSGDSYISWMWKKATTTNGVDIVTYTGTGAAQTIAHSLGVAPKMIIVKDRGAANDGAVYHASNTAAPETDYLLLNSTAATADDDTYWNDTAPTASVFSVKSNADTNASGNSYVAYLFAEKEGFSKFGSYTGNGSADGPFIYTGFKPKYVLIKRTDTTGQWQAQDTARQSYNVMGPVQFLNLNEADATGFSAYDTDFLANGFKIRASTPDRNASGGTYIYAAFAEQPFKYSAAPAASASSGFLQALAFLIGMVF